MHWPSRPASDHSLVSAAQTDSATGRAAMNNDLQSLTDTTKPHELVGVQREPVAFAVENDRSRPVGPYRVLRLEDFAAIGNDSGDRLIQPSVGVQINHWSLVRRLIVSAIEKAPADFTFVALHKRH